MMQYKSYSGRVEFDDESGLFEGVVVGLRDVVTFAGASVEELRRAFRESVDDYLDMCREDGVDPEKPCSGQFLVRADPDLHRRLLMLSAASEESLNSWVVGRLRRETARCLGERVEASPEASPEAAFVYAEVAAASGVALRPGGSATGQFDVPPRHGRIRFESPDATSGSGVGVGSLELTG